MKKLLLVLIGLLSSLDISAQLGYRCDGKFVQLTPYTTDFFYVQTRNQESTLLLKEAIAHNVLSQKEVKDNVLEISEKSYFVSSLSNLSEKDYVSELFRDSKGNPIYVLPRIVLSVKNNNVIGDVLNKYSDILELDTTHSLKGMTILKCNLPTAQDVLKIVSELDAMNEVIWCEPDMLCKFSQHDMNPFFPMQYYLQNNNLGQYDINVVPAWNLTTANKNIIVAVIDDGLDFDHEDLYGNVLQGYTSGNDSGYGQPQNENTINCKGHGVVCAGIIGANNNDIGVLGVAYGVKLLPVNIVPNIPYQIDNFIYEGFASVMELSYAIQWAAERADILSCSWGGQDESNAIRNAINNAMTNGRNGKGCIVVAASGNSYNGDMTVSFPACIDGVIAVGAIDKYGNIQPYSQRGIDLDLVAPSGLCNMAGDVVTTDRMGYLGYNPNDISTGSDLTNINYTQNFGGTSGACPQVAGVAALMLSANPNLTVNQVRTILRGTAHDLGDMGFDTTYGYGLVDAFAAVKAAYSYNLDISGSTRPCNSEVYSIIDLPDSLTVTWSWHPSLVHLSNMETMVETEIAQPEMHILDPVLPPIFSDVIVRNNQPAANQCTLIVPEGTYVKGTLKATVKRNGITICVLEKNLDSSDGFSGTYTRAHVGNATIGPNQFVSGSTIVANYGDVLNIQSPYFIDANISKTSTIPLSWTHNNNTIHFVIPMSATQTNDAATISFSGSNSDYCMAFRFNVYVNPLDELMASAPSYDVQITSEGQDYVFSVVSSEGIDSQSQADVFSADWSLTIVNTLTGQKMYGGTVSGATLSVSTESWKDGIYFARAIIGDNVITKKMSKGR